MVVQGFVLFGTERYPKHIADHRVDRCIWAFVRLGMSGRHTHPLAHADVSMLEIDKEHRDVDSI